ncbi:alpha-ketoglutarate dehydrogenase complex subunit [Colletotrichum sojae]|uniref:Alpha-ketoglutarate dehydrogenase complex subunit n=1 Tax=Colletotrichum sojae TaxID=2175907 RepID=A0A8H6JMB0_9PEZI|nr:alpha-ketoglutarate dehydrogenase complex subunit [Colletotrichum sojae]
MFLIGMGAGDQHKLQREIRRSAPAYVGADRIFLSGHLADHWRNIAACIRGGAKSMADFVSALEKVDKPVRFMGSARKALQPKAALDDVAAFQRRLSSCRDTIRLSLQAALLWNHALNRDIANSRVELPGLAELKESIHRLADRITSLEQKMDANDAEEEMAGLSNLRNCVQSAASVTSSATSLSLTADLASFANRWPGQDVSLPDSERVPPAFLAADDEADSGDGIEMDIVHVQLEKGRKQLDAEDHAAAEQLLQKAMTRSRGYRLVHKHSSMLAAGLLNLAVLYDRQGRWLEAKEAMTDRLVLLSRSATSDSHHILDGKLALSWYLLKLGDAVQTPPTR